MRLIMDDMVMSSAQALWTTAHSMSSYTDNASYAEQYRLQYEKDSYDNWRVRHGNDLYNTIQTPSWKIFQGTPEEKKETINRMILLLL